MQGSHPAIIKLLHRISDNRESYKLISVAQLKSSTKHADMYSRFDTYHEYLNNCAYRSMADRATHNSLVTGSSPVRRTT